MPAALPQHGGWIRSSHSTVNSCVEIRPEHAHLSVRDSKDPEGPRLRFTSAAWTTFLGSVRGAVRDSVRGRERG
ncbi:DUF397 domain-containing protein [Streptomyces sp. ODS28]|uniref:DUF397 domain-containing protein n=1 Tax=Streptomyces sp. ODS28 TaxID=3136688 RepID=UPI0031F150D8